MTPILTIEHLTKIYRVGFWGRKKTAVTGIDLSIHENEIFGFLGPNGAGKTTTLKAILGIIHPTSGVIRLFDRPASELDLKKNIGYLPENPYFYTYLTARETLDFYGQLFEIPKLERRRRTEALLDQVGLKEAKDEPLRHFSKGMLQRVGIAQALINDPKFIILDEPMSGLDPIGRKEVRDIILDLKARGKTVFFSSHILSDVEMICDRVAIVHKGNISRIGILEEMLAADTETVEMTIKGLGPNGVAEMEQLKIRTIQSGDKTLVIARTAVEIKTVHDLVKKHDGLFISIIPQKMTLESLFMSHVTDRQPERSPTREAKND